MSEWQPIETVPRDGTPVLVYADPESKMVDTPFMGVREWYAYSPSSGTWGDPNVSGYEVDDYLSVEKYLTHWMPLPAPPDTSQVGICEANEPKTNTTGDEG